MIDQTGTGFVHRHNQQDGSWDTICTGCFITVATEQDECRLQKHELIHRCDPHVRMRMALTPELRSDLF